MSQPAVVAVTDGSWFHHFRPQDERRTWDEVNFWRPAAQQPFRALPVGGPLFFRLKAPINAIAGFGFFAVAAQMRVAMAWEIFGERNGDPSFGQFTERIRRYRSYLHEQPSAERVEDQVLSTGPHK